MVNYNSCEKKSDGPLAQKCVKNVKYEGGHTK